MAFTANDLREGNVISHKNGLWRVIERVHVKPGKGGAYIQTELKNIKNSSKLNERFRSDEHVEKVIFESIPVNFMYRDGDQLEFMDLESCEQISVAMDVIGKDVNFLQDNMKVHLEKIGDDIVGIVLPENVKLRVIKTDPYIKNQTITATFKPATLENGITVQVPQFVTENDEILVRTKDCTYLERAK